MTSISKNVYIDKLNAIVNKYNKTYHTTIKMKPIDVKDNTYINTNKEVNYKDPINYKDFIKNYKDLKLVIILEFQSIKTYLLKGICLIGVKKFLF